MIAIRSRQAEMEKIAIPRNEAELITLRSLFEAEDIQYFVHNDNFGTMLVGPLISQYNAKAVMVPVEFAGRAREIVAELRRSEATTAESKPGFMDRVRMVFEAAVFSWFVPGRRWKRPTHSGHDPAGDDS